MTVVAREQERCSECLRPEHYSRLLSEQYGATCEREIVVKWLRLRSKETWPDEPHFDKRGWKALAGRLRLQSANFAGMARAIEEGVHRGY